MLRPGRWLPDSADWEPPARPRLADLPSYHAVGRALVLAALEAQGGSALASLRAVGSGVSQTHPRREGADPCGNIPA